MLHQSYEQVVLRDRPHAYYRPAGGTSATVVPNLAPGMPLGDGTSSAGRYNLTTAVDQAAMRGIPGAADPVASKIGSEGWREPLPAIAKNTNVLPSDTGRGTLECWFYPSSSANTTSRFMLMARTVPTYGTFAAVYFVGSTAKLCATWHPLSPIVGVDNIRFNDWNHAVAIFRAASNYEIWLNGRLQGTITGSGSVNVFYGAAEKYYSIFGTTQAVNPTVFGSGTLTSGDSGTGNATLVGGLAECAEYPHALSPSQIVDHYQAGLGLRRRTSIDAAFGYPYAATAAPPPAPDLTAITTPLPNRRVALMSDRPR